MVPQTQNYGWSKSGYFVGHATYQLFRTIVIQKCFNDDAKMRCNRHDAYGVEMTIATRNVPRATCTKLETWTPGATTISSAQKWLCVRTSL